MVKWNVTWEESFPGKGALMVWQVPTSAGPGYVRAGSERGRLRAADADRDHVAGLLSTAYTEGRLSKDEYDARLDHALSARTYADLDQVISDLPAAPPALAYPVTRTNGLAIASLACGIGQVVAGPLATIPAIVLGHMARGQIRRTGEQGAGLALGGLILGWSALILGMLLIVVAVAAVSGHVQSPMPMPPGGPPGP
jgi:hypothetical protein